MASWLHNMYLLLRFCPKAVKLLTREQGLDSSESLRVLMDKNVDGVCNVKRKTSSKNVNQMPDRSNRFHS